MFYLKASKRASALVARNAQRNFHCSIILSNDKDDLKSLFDRYKVNATNSGTDTTNDNGSINVEDDGEDKLKSLFAKFSQSSNSSASSSNTNKNKFHSTSNNKITNLHAILGGKVTGKVKKEKKTPKFNPKRDIDYSKIPEELHVAVKWIKNEATKTVLIHTQANNFFLFKNITQLINETDWNNNGILIKKKGLSYSELKDFISDDLLYIPLEATELASVVHIVPVEKLDLEYYKSLEKKSIIMKLGGGSFLNQIEEKEANLVEANNAATSNDKIFKPIPISWECQLSDLNRKFDTALRLMKKNYKLDLQLGPAAYLKSSMFSKNHINKVHGVTWSGMKNNTSLSEKEDKEFKEAVNQFFITRRYNANKLLTIRNDIYSEVLQFLDSLQAKYKVYGNVETFIVVSVHEYNLNARDEWLKNQESKEDIGYNVIQDTTEIAPLKQLTPTNKNSKKGKKNKKDPNSKTRAGAKVSEVTDFYNMKIED